MMIQIGPKYHFQSSSIFGLYSWNFKWILRVWLKFLDLSPSAIIVVVGPITQRDHGIHKWTILITIGRGWITSQSRWRTVSGQNLIFFSNLNSTTLFLKFLSDSKGDFDDFFIEYDSKPLNLTFQIICG